MAKASAPVLRMQHTGEERGMKLKQSRHKEFQGDKAEATQHTQDHIAHSLPQAVPQKHTMVGTDGAHQP